MGNAEREGEREKGEQERRIIPYAIVSLTLIIYSQVRHVEGEEEVRRRGRRG